jgi:hypothetical protein
LECRLRRQIERSRQVKRSSEIPVFLRQQTRLRYSKYLEQIPVTLLSRGAYRWFGEGACSLLQLLGVSPTTFLKTVAK